MVFLFDNGNTIIGDIMKIRFGYVAISQALDLTSSSNVTYAEFKKTNNYDKIDNVIKSNLEALIGILKYNIKNNIHFYRLTSKLIPLATHKEVTFDYLKKYEKYYKQISTLINDNNMRIDVHPDQFCVLNSTNKEVVKSTINIIKFYKNMLDTMKLKTYMILHIGSSAFGKQKSITRFINNFKLIDQETRKMIIIENDDKIYNIKDTLYLAKKLNIPMVLDYHHYKCNNEGEKIEDYITEIFNTWKKDTPKVHLSSPKSKKEYRSHNDYINIDDFIEFHNKIRSINIDFDIMIEAKEKDFALFKLIRELKYKGYKIIDDTIVNLEI